MRSTNERKAFGVRKNLVRVVVGLAAAGAMTASVGASAAGAASEGPAAPAKTEASIHGWARMYFPAPGNDVQVTVNAHGVYTGPAFPDRSWGTFRIYHRIADPSGGKAFVNWGDFDVDCLTTGGPTATVTGTLVRAAPGSPWKLGVRTGLSFYAPRGGGRGRIGMAGMPATPLSRCMAPAADAPVTRGGYTLEDKTPIR